MELFVVTYCNNPKNFDVVKRDKVHKGIIETSVLATSRPKDDFHRFPGKRFFAVAVWKNAVRVKPQELGGYDPKQVTQEFKDLLSSPERKINWKDEA
jgi:hypothetical protein